MKITTGKQKKASTVYVVLGCVDHEDRQPIAVTSSYKLAGVAIESDRVLHRVSGMYGFDSYQIKRFKLDTAVYESSFGTRRKVRSL